MNFVELARRSCLNRQVGVSWVDADAIFTESRPFGADAETLSNTIKYEAPVSVRRGVVEGVGLHRSEGVEGVSAAAVHLAAPDCARLHH